MTSLEDRIQEVALLIKDKDATIDEQQKMLASDRDIRDLMGARDAMDYAATLHAVSHRTAAGLAQHDGLYRQDDWRKGTKERDSRYVSG